jgi:hypothetical protein
MFVKGYFENIKWNLNLLKNKTTTKNLCTRYTEIIGILFVIIHSKCFICNWLDFISGNIHSRVAKY